ncbi:hypothetical protein APHAL10511_008338 [Amanita phalloides]|nr:hypothetical protein APHAL10511_008338 [Amanita phalloides]
MQDILRRRPLEKRHTKPCKYYQTMSCPLPADVCDFAHVPVNPSPGFTIDDPCRYYQTGFCANGAWCSYSHSIDVSPAVADAVMTPPGQRMRSLSASGLRPVIPQSGVDQPPPIISTHMHVASVCNRPPSYSPLAPTHSPISSHAPPPLVEPKLFLNASYPPPSPTAYTDVFDDFVVCTEDPHMSEHAHTHQSRVYIADTMSPVHMPPYPTSPSHRYLSMGPLSPRFQVQSPMYTLGPKYVPVSIPLKKRRSRGVSKKKVEKYKTKPCRFFAMDGSCPNGDSCTFIHGEDTELLRKITMKTTTLKRNGCGADSSESTSESAPSDEEHVLRVGAITISQNIDQGDWRTDRANSRSPLFLPQLDAQFTRVPASNGWAGKRFNGRPRANSIPSTPSASSQMSVENLFPAECPAVL